MRETKEKYNKKVDIAVDAFTKSIKGMHNDSIPKVQTMQMFNIVISLTRIAEALEENNTLTKERVYRDESESRINIEEELKKVRHIREQKII